MLVDTFKQRCQPPFSHISLKPIAGSEIWTTFAGLTSLFYLDATGGPKSQARNIYYR